MNRKVAWITGGSSGIGRATALRFAREGVMVALLANSAEELNEVAGQIRKLGAECLTRTADIRDAVAVKVTADEIQARWGRLDIVFINAGQNGVWAPIDELTADDWDETIEVNLKGAFLTARAAVPLLRKQGGTILFNSSINGNRIFRNTGATPYACSKAAVTALGKMLAVELARDKIRVNVICPGAILTPIFDKSQKRDIPATPYDHDHRDTIPLTDGRLGSPEQVADLAYFLASDSARFITGATIYIDGAESLA